MADKTTERTTPQVLSRQGRIGTAPLAANYSAYRTMRTHPTIAVARSLTAAPILAGQWTVESDDDAPDEWVRMVQDNMMPMRPDFLEKAILGGIDFGYQAFEKVFAARDGLWQLTKLKDLLPDLTELMVDEKTGALAGLKQYEIELDLNACCVLSFRVEGTNWYGTPLLENVRATYNQWTDCNDGAARYDVKVAGSHFLVYFPPGQSEDQNGTLKNNVELAEAFIEALESSGSIAIPDTAAAYIDTLNQKGPGGWRIEILEDKGGRQPTFIQRLEYLDKLLARGMILPERSIQEGQHGTLAEAQAHTDLALTMAELTHAKVTTEANRQVVDQLLAVNYGPTAVGKVRLVASPLVDSKREFLRQVYQTFLANPSGFLEEGPQIDTDGLKDALGIPKSAEVAQAGESPAGLSLRSDFTDNPVVARTVRGIYRRLGVEGNGRTAEAD